MAQSRGLRRPSTDPTHHNHPKTTVKDTGTGNSGSLHTTTLVEDQTIDDKINAPNPQGRKKTADKKGEKDDEAVAVKETFPPVPLLQRYRFSTRFEIFFEHYRLHWDF